MKTLLLMRHAHAVSDNSAYDDHERPLSERGRDVAIATAGLLEGFQIDRVVCSSAVRTTQTAELIAASCAVKRSHLHVADALYLAQTMAYRDVAVSHAQPSDEVVLVVGHNPGIASLINTWANESLAVPPATVAAFRMNTNCWNDLQNSDSRFPAMVDYISNGQRNSAAD